jgi:hypothetical protein
MPIILPTPEELAQVPWHKRKQVMVKVQRLLQAYQVMPIAKSKEDRERSDHLLGELIRAEAKVLLDQMGMHPDWATHREAIS